MSKRTPWVRALAYPLEETTVITAPGFVRTDLLVNLRRPPASEPPSIHKLDLELGGVRLTTPQMGMDVGIIRNDEKLLWWDLSDPQEAAQVGGYTLKPYLVPRSNRIAGSLWEVPGAADPLPLDWLPTNPSVMTADYWETCQPDAEPQTEAVAWRGTDRDTEYGLTTTQKLPEGQSFAVRLWITGTAPVFSDDEDDGPYLNFIWGRGKWAISLSLFKPPALCKFVNGAWRRARNFDKEFGVDLLSTGEPIWLRVAHVAGRLVVEIETAAGKKARVVYTEVLPDAFGVNEAQAVQVPSGVASWRGRGVSFSAQLHEYWWGRWVDASTDDYGIVTPAHFDGAGSFEREYTCTRRVNRLAVTATAFGYYGNGNPFRRRDMYEGDAGRVATVTDEAVLDNRNRTTGKRRYTCTLEAHNPYISRDWLETSETCMAGAITPFVSAVAVRVGSSRTASSNDPIDLRPALRTVTEDLADPMVQAGPMWQLGIWRNLLPASIHQGTGNPIGNSWGDYVGKYHRLDVDLSWQGDDGVLGAGDPPYEGAEAAYCRRLIGFLVSEAPDSPGPGRYPATLTARDFSVLLQPPAGMVDGRYGPLDLLLAEKLADGDRKLRGWEGVRYILETAVGPDFAAALEHVFPAGHYDLLQHRTLLDPPSGSFFFPPPWGQSAYQWIMQLAERDFAVFFWAASASDPTTVVPHYVNYYSYLANAPEMTVPDAVYLAGDVDDLILRAGSQHEPMQDFNRVLVWGAAPGQGDFGGVMPALQAFSAEARIETGSPVREQNIDETWERTKLLRGSHFWLGRVARLVALNTARLIRGVDQRGISITIRGNPYLWWGWKVRPRMNATQSDPHGLALHNQLCRIIRLRNATDLEAGKYETTLRVAPEPEV